MGLKQTENDRRNRLGGRAMASPLPGEEVVISGLSGVFPNSHDVHEFRENLFKKIDMLSINTRWDNDHPEIPPRLGIMPDINKFDGGFFGFHERQINSSDPICRRMLEKSIEAIFDAGLHPSDLENTRTGVFIGSCFSDCERSLLFENGLSQSYALTGTERSMLAHRISYFLKLKGPSHNSDTACSSSLYAFEHAFRAIRIGEVDNAIVGGINLCVHPYLTLQFARLGVLSKDGSCRPFDKTANGYVRSEAAGVLMLQKSKDAKRIYAEVIHAKTNCDGYKEQGITYPSGSTQRALLSDFYEECNIDPYSLSFLEAHGTGTRAGDPEECEAIDEVFAKNRKTPLLMGSVKSGIGHTEPASGVCSIIKCIIGMETGLIPPNINFTKPRDEMKGLLEGRMKVVTEKMSFQDNRGLLGVSSFGFGGGNCHVLLRKNPKEKINDGIPKDDLPRIVCVSGRTEEAVTCLLDEVSENTFDTEHIKLLHELFRKNIQNHPYRGFTLVSKTSEITRSLSYSPEEKKPLCILFGELNNWWDIGNHLMQLPMFADSMQRIQEYLSGKGINILDAVLNKSSVRNSDHIMGSLAVQMGIADVLNLLEIKSTNNIGYFIGQLLSAYYEGILNLEETINCGLILDEATDMVNDLPKEKSNQLYNGTTGVGITNGYKIKLEKFKLILKSNGFLETKDYLLQNLTKILGKTWNGKHTKDKYGSIDHFIKILLNDITQNYLPNLNTVVLKIGASHIYEEPEDITILSFPNSECKNYLISFLKTLGSLYQHGYNPQFEKLYPVISFPVSRGTRMISPYIKWDHSRDLWVPNFNFDKKKDVRYISVKLALTDELAYISGHVIDGRNLFPAIGYLFLVWEGLSLMTGIAIESMNIAFEHCKFIRAITMPTKGVIQLDICIQEGSGNFEIAEGDSPVVIGRLSQVEENKNETVNHTYKTTSEYKYQGLLTTKDIYKELRLRGYRYTGAFRAIQQCDITASNGTIKWENNWVTFIDNMLQMKILQTDSRLLYVPMYIARLDINAKSHLDWIEKEYAAEDMPHLEVFNDLNSGVISCGGIHLRGLIASSINRKKNMAVPVLEKYLFVPNNATVETEQSVRINMQIILENALVYKVKVVELIDVSTREDVTPLTPIIQSILTDQPLVQPLLKILSKVPLNVPVEVEDKKLTTETDCMLVIASDILARSGVLKEAFDSLKENGYIISRESKDYDVSNNICSGITILTVHRTPHETLLLLQKETKSREPYFMKINSSNFSWVPAVQESIRRKHDTVLYSEKEPNNGIIGLVNCLRKEPYSKNVKCIFVADENTELNLKEMKNQLQKNMAINVYKNGHWGTYRHLLLNDINTVDRDHCLVNVMVKGDLSSLKWIEGPLRYNTLVPPETELIYVYYSALNFKDVMTASGRINVDVVTANRLEQECVQGFEFSGRDASGNRVMGLVSHGALSTLVLADPYLTFSVPDNWSLEEAATVPAVYGTVIYALLVRGRLKKNDSILIHSGTGGIGQAAINIASHYGCTIYTTVGTKEKRDYIRKAYPHIKDSHIGNSRDESFEEMIYRETNGRGVDIVLNSLAEEKLLASVKCLAKGGQFLEIGRFDATNNNYVNLLLLEKEASFHGVMLDLLFSETPDTKSIISKLILNEIKSGSVKPLNTNIFKFNEIEQAFRFMAAGKHIGKIIVEVRKSENKLLAVPSQQKYPCIPRYLCDPEKTYVILGGLGGFGLELADWLVLRGAKKLVLASRKGISNGYQSMRISIWTSYGVFVNISKADITSKGGCMRLIEEAQELGPIDAIFNLAVVLEDALFEDQTPGTFEISFGPKAYATHYLDELTRKMCPNLRDFVVFSSVSCGRGNTGQTNYGMSNSVMERICEKRRRDGYPALAIEWGAVGEVGLVAQMEEEHSIMEIGGTLQQSISSCLQVFDALLKQKEAAIVSSMVVAEKHLRSANNVLDAVTNILGISDSKSVSLYSTLPELGMDSMHAVEIKQTLERDYEIFLTPKDIRTITLARLEQIQVEKISGTESDCKKDESHFGLEMLFRLIGEESESSLPYIQLKSNVDEKLVAPKVILFPGVEGFAKVFTTLSSYLNAHTISMQYLCPNEKDTIRDMAELLMPYAVEHITKMEPFNIVAYSYGTVVALEVVSILESQGYTGNIICIDGSPLFIKKMVKQIFMESDQLFETVFVSHILSFFLPSEIIFKYKENIINCSTLEEKVQFAADLLKQEIGKELTYQKKVAHGIYRRMKAVENYTPSYSKLKSKVLLYKPKDINLRDISEDYDLSQFFEKPVTVQNFDGNHLTILENESLAESLDKNLLF